MGFFVGVLKLKVAKPQKVFQFVSNLQKKGAKLSLNRWIVSSLGRELVPFFWRFEPK